MSGFIELAGLALWGWEMTRNIRFGQRLAANPERLVPLPVTAHWVPDAQTKVCELLHRYPDLLPVFLHYGFTPLANPALRRMIARVVTIEQVCRRESVDLDSFLQELRSSIAAAKRPAMLPS